MKHYIIVALCSSVLIGICSSNSLFYSGTCKMIKNSFPTTAPSGIYPVALGNKQIEVYCEMGLNGGGYTFLSPKVMTQITHADLQTMITDRKSVLMRIRRCDGTQTYSVLEQLPQFQSIPIFIGLNNHTGFQVQNHTCMPRIGTPYLFVGFLPLTIAAVQGAVQGVVANSVSYTFTNCDGNGNSRMIIFPNFNEITPTTYAYNLEWPFCTNIFNGALPNPSGRIMPYDYFMFTEFHFGGCGCYAQSDQKLRNKCILGFQIGFR